MAESEREFVFADLKGDLDQIGHLAGGILWKAGGPEWLHPARTGTISLRIERCAMRKTRRVGKVTRLCAEIINIPRQSQIFSISLITCYVYSTVENVKLSGSWRTSVTGAAPLSGGILRQRGVPGA